MRREHIFITTKHFENCHKFQIFGVREKSINQLGLVNKGDIVYFYNKKDELIIGPYKVASEIFYNEEPVWGKNKKGRGEYPYRVKIKSCKKIYRLDVSIFSQFAEKKNIRIDSQDLVQRSIFTLLPKDYGKLERILLKGEKFKKKIKRKALKQKKITIKFAEEKGFNEAFLEYFLLKKFDKYFGNNLMPYNQFRIDLLGRRIDILAVSKEKILLIELKPGRITERDIHQFKKYEEWIKDGKELLKQFFKKDLKNAKIEALIIGSEIQKDLPHSNIKNINIKKYSLNKDKNEIELSDL